MTRSAFNLWNFAAYQLAWFAVIVGVSRGFAPAGAAVAVLVTAVHLAMRREKIERRLVGLAALIGLLVDSTLAISGQVQFAGDGPHGIAPYWMIALWIAFATTLNHSLRWLMARPVIAGIAGAVGGPLAYFAGAKLGALTLVTPALTLPLIALLWTPATVALSMIVLRASVSTPGSVPA